MSYQRQNHCSHRRLKHENFATMSDFGDGRQILCQKTLWNFYRQSKECSFQNAVRARQCPSIMPSTVHPQNRAILAMTKNRLEPSVDFLVLYSYISKWKFDSICLQFLLLILPLPVLNAGSCHCQSIACANRGWRLAVNGSIVDRVCIIIAIHYRAQ